MSQNKNNTDNNFDKEKYSDKDIRVLSTIDAIRMNPGMYVGSTGSEGLHHIVSEVFENSADEASIRKYRTTVKVTLSDDLRSITIEDDGRGIPMGINPTSQVSSLETVFTYVHSGAKFSKSDDSRKRAYETSGGMHGVGLTAVNALSSELNVWSKHDGKIGHITFKKGRIADGDGLEIKDYSGSDTGTIISFTPDEDIFNDVSHFNPVLIAERLEELARLNRYLVFYFFSSQKEKDPKIFSFDTGLIGWVKEINFENSLKKIGTSEDTEICYGEHSAPSSAKKQGYFNLNFALQYRNDSGKINIKSFCNNIFTDNGGTHQEGFERGLIQVCKRLIKEKYPNLSSKDDFDVLSSDVLEGLTAIVSINMQDQVFAGQTKNKLVNPWVREYVKSETDRIINNFFQDNYSTAESIFSKIISAVQERNFVERRKNLINKSSRDVVFLPGKLIDCPSKIFHNRKLYILEGDSAGGSAKLAKDDEQAILTVRGKVVNSAKSIDLKIFKNNEIISIINAIGFNVDEIIDNNYSLFWELVNSNEDISNRKITISENFSYEEDGVKKTIPSNILLNISQIRILVNETKKKLLSKLRYNKVIIMADADADGKHIECLLITFFVKYFRFLVEEHHLFLAVTPLYRIQGKKETVYLYDDNELDSYRLDNPNQKEYTIQRFKGLGEMNPKQLRETTMGSDNCLHSLIYSNHGEIEKVINELMGVESSFRKKRLEEAQYKNAKLIVNDNKVEIHHALLVKFLTYAYEVIEDRALPNLQDGFKPVQRRIIYTLYELGLFPNKPYRKSSKLVGDVMSKYHPHGDSSIYQAMVKMAQDFSSRYPIIDGQGNWGSIDGDPAAAMRYTEVKMTPFGVYLLENYLPFDTVEMIENYDGNEKEPKILPASLNLLLNGSSGIAVGMNTNIPPHNIGELIDTTIRLVKNFDLTTRDLFDTFQGPDFPTGGIILNKEDLLDTYDKGEGIFYLRAKAEIISSKNNDKKDTIIVYQLPYKVNKASLVDKINHLIKEKKIKGLRSVQDYSNFERSVDIRLSFDYNYDGNIILNKLFQSTDLQISFSMRIRALLEEKPKIFSLKEVICHFIIKSLEHIEKKAQFIRNKNDKDLTSLKIRSLIIENYQKVAEIARENSLEDERGEKIENLFSEEIKELNIDRKDFVNRVLDTQAAFRQFTPDRRKDLYNRISNIKEHNVQLSLLINNPEEREKKLIDELIQLKEKYLFNVRRTFFSEDSHIIDDRKTTPYENRLVIFSQVKNKENEFNSYINVHEVNSIESTNIPSQGKILKIRGDGNFILSVNRRDDIWAFSNYGKLYSITFYKFFSVNKSTNLREEYGLGLEKDEFFTFFLPISEVNLLNRSEKKIIIVTKKGKVKIIPLSKLEKIQSSGKILINLKKEIIEKCEKHQNLLNEHKKTDCCDKSQGIKAYVSCSNFKELQANIKRCKNCLPASKSLSNSDDDFIVKSVIIEENNIFNLEAVIERDGKTKFFSEDKNYENKRIWNLKIPLYLNVRKNYCFAHQAKISEHKSYHSCYVRCDIIRELRKKISICIDCGRQENFFRKLRTKIKCKSVIDLLVITNDDFKKKDSLKMLLLREDNSFIKKNWDIERNNLGKPFTLKKSNYCLEHWNKLSSSQNSYENLISDLRNAKDDLKRKIIVSPIGLSKKKKLLSMSGLSIAKNEEISLSSINENYELTEEAISKYHDDLLNRIKEFNTFSEKVKKNSIFISKIKDESKSCNLCAGYCEKHQNLLNEHKKTDCCDKSQGIKAYVSCSNFKELQANIKRCKNCLSLKDKKSFVGVFNPLKDVFLFNKEEKYEIYLIAGEFSCLYRKNDFSSFIQEDKKKRIQLYRNSKKIDNIFFAHK